MKLEIRNWKLAIICLLWASIFTSCSNNDDLGPSIFDSTEETLDPTSYTYKFDLFLQKEFLKPYNLQFAYKMQDISVDKDYNLVPASFENSKKLAVLVKYLWFDVYKKVADSTFLRKYGPRMIHLIGSPGYNPANGTELLGLAEGGIKISLLKVNQIDISNVETLNEYYFKTMHHEFAHILHQTKSYPVDFNLISYKDYSPYSWQDRPNEIAWSLGFVSPYGSSQTREDFVEVIANYIVKTDAQWNSMLINSAKGWKIDAETSRVIETMDTTYKDTIINDKLERLMKLRNVDTDGVNGKEVILKKLDICRQWLLGSWGISLDALRDEVQTRQSNIDINALLSEIEK